MHPNPAFRKEDDSRAWAFAASRGFGVLSIHGESLPLAAHIPFLCSTDSIEAHLVRSNPIARALRAGPVPALLIVSGPDGYISPDWYGEDDKVPTWNYVAVHLKGVLSLAPPDRLIGHLERLSAQFEGHLPKPPWTHHKMTPGVMEGMMRQILPVTMRVDAIESTYKLNQNRSDQARHNAANMLARGDTPGMETAQLAELMTGVPDE
ncbi:MAG: FMN-binding negative transcriptional regulator [Pseudomonadota bacterium]